MWQQPSPKMLAEQVEAVASEQLASERGLLPLLLAAERTTGRSPLRPEKITPELTVAVLVSAVSETKSQVQGSRAVKHSPRLAWDVLVRLFGGDDELRRAIDEPRPISGALPGYAAVLSLADKYASGWRPKDFSDSFEGPD
jgi:hypothetical protein